MAQIKWDAPGKRVYETGVDRGVFYPTIGAGVAWNGLVSVVDTASGGDVTSHYYDGVKYFDEAKTSDYAATITAFTYPEDFEAVTGSPEDGGLIFDDQPREIFGLSYRSLVGNDLEGIDYGYRIHLVYNATASPMILSANTLSNQPDATNFSWNITTVPEPVPGRRPTAHFIFDTTKSPVSRIEELERILYGTSTTAPRLPTIDELLDIAHMGDRLEIIPNTATGLAKLDYRGLADLFGNMDVGLYKKHAESRLVATATPGLYTLGA